MAPIALALDWVPVRGWLLSHGLRILLIILISFILYWLLRRAVPRVIRAATITALRDRPPEEITKRSQTLASVITTTGGTVILLAALFTVLSELAFNIAPFLTGAGIAGVALGFGAQSLVRDVLSGFFILTENQYGHGDLVRVAGVSGLVEEVTLRRTVLRDIDGTVHSIPNGEIRLSSNLTKEAPRVNLNIRVSYQEDIDRVIEVINRVSRELAADERYASMIVEIPQALWVEGFEDLGVVIKVSGITKPLKQWEVTRELRRKVKKAFDHEGIEMK